MDASKVLAIVLREMTAYGRGWRADWSWFDGRTLRDQLDGLAAWAKRVQEPEVAIGDADFNAGTLFEKEQHEE